MSDENRLASSGEEKPKMVDIASLIPVKTSIAISIGTLFIRQLQSSDWKYLNLDNSIELARASVQRLCCRIEDKQDSSPLFDDDLNLLTDTDYQALVQAIAKQNGWRELPDGAGLSELGIVITKEKKLIKARHEKTLGDMRKSIAASYSFLEEGTLEKLQRQMAGVADIRKALAGTDSIQAALRATSLKDDSWSKSLTDTDTIGKEKRSFEVKNSTTQLRSPKAFDTPHIMPPPQFEETPMGRATLKSLENSQQVAEKMDALVVVVTGLNQTMVQDVLPQWFKKIDNDQTAANKALVQAANSLKLTKWAVFVSVVATIASVVVAVIATRWQIDVAKSIDRENSEQQKRVEVVLREQLAVQKIFIEQQAKDAAAVRGVMEASNQVSSIAKQNGRKVK